MLCRLSSISARLFELELLELPDTTLRRLMSRASVLFHECPGGTYSPSASVPSSSSSSSSIIALGRGFFFRTLVDAGVAVDEDDEDDCLAMLLGSSGTGAISADDRGAASVSSSGCGGCGVDWRLRLVTFTVVVRGLISVASGSGLRIFLQYHSHRSRGSRSLA